MRHAVIAAARELERRMPDRVTTAWWKEERGERIFTDFNQAARDRTIAEQPTLRWALPTASVSTPLEWDGLDAVTPTDFTVRTVPERLRDQGDPWEHMHDEPGRQATCCWSGGSATSRSGLTEMPVPAPTTPRCRGSRRECSRRRRSPTIRTRTASGSPVPEVLEGRVQRTSSPKS